LFFPGIKLSFPLTFIRACLKIPRSAVFAEKVGWRGAMKENIACGSSTAKQRSQTAVSAKSLRAAGLLALSGVGSVVTARCGDAPPLPPWPKPKSLAAAPLAILRQALTLEVSIDTDANARTKQWTKYEIVSLRAFHEP